MRFFTRFSITRAMSTQYGLWTKDQLIARIVELETRVKEVKSNEIGHSSSKKASIPPNEPTTSITTTPAITTPETTSAIVSDKPAKAPKKQFDFAAHPQRFIALRFAYLGWNYNGLAYQYEPTEFPTVEAEILQALSKAKLISEPEPTVCNFSRCGRTDKGVSAMNQVISLDVRSNLTPEEQLDSKNDSKELPYMNILNSMLPADIMITAICLRPPESFNARFSCLSRHYRYFIHRDSLDIPLMQEAAAKYEGRHDFRNLCKLDGSKQIINHVRDIISSRIIPHDTDPNYVIFDLKGLAFLWHQVRCMVAILLMVGQKLEQPTLIDELLDVEKNPRRPAYAMAHDVPLVLYDCEFPEMEWISFSQDAVSSKVRREVARMRGVIQSYEIRALMGNYMKQVFFGDHPDTEKMYAGYDVLNSGDGQGRLYKKHLPVMSRTLGDPVELVNQRWREKKKRKLEEEERALAE